MTLSTTQKTILEAAASRADQLLTPPKIPAAARAAVAKALVKAGLAEAFQPSVYNAADLWTLEGHTRLLRITPAGRQAIGIDPAPTDAEVAASYETEEAEAAMEEEGVEAEDDRPRHEQLGIDERRIYGSDEEWEAAAPQRQAEDLALLDQAPEPAAFPGRISQEAAQALFKACSVAANWLEIDDYATPEAVLDRLKRALGAATTAKAPSPAANRAPREGTKQEQVLALLRRPEGARSSEIAEATGWQPHTVRGFLAGLKKKGFRVVTKGRIRMVGPNRTGAHGSYTVYAVEG